MLSSKVIVMLVLFEFHTCEAVSPWISIDVFLPPKSVGFLVAKIYLPNLIVHAFFWFSEQVRAEAIRLSQ